MAVPLLGGMATGLAMRPGRVVAIFGGLALGLVLLVGMGFAALLEARGQLEPAPRERASLPTRAQMAMLLEASARSGVRIYLLTAAALVTGAVDVDAETVGRLGCGLGAAIEHEWTSSRGAGGVDAGGDAALWSALMSVLQSEGLVARTLLLEEHLSYGEYAGAIHEAITASLDCVAGFVPMPCAPALAALPELGWEWERGEVYCAEEAADGESEESGRLVMRAEWGYRGVAVATGR